MTIKPIAFRIQAELEPQSPLHIATNKMFNVRGSQVQASDMYPLGQNLRGAFGHIFLDMKSKVVDTYDNGHPSIYFRDGLVKHQDGGTMVPMLRLDKGIRETVYRCSRCQQITPYPVNREPMTGVSLTEGTVRNMFLTDIIVNRGIKFGFEAILNMKEQNAEEYLSEFMAALKYVEDIGLYIGKRNAKGLGKTLLRNRMVQPVTMDDIKKRAEAIAATVNKDGGKITVHLLSDTIARFPLSGDDVVREAKNAAKFFDPNYTAYKDPKLTPIGKPIELTTSLTFLDLKVKAGGIPKFAKADGAISRGSQFSYQVTDATPEFWNALAMAEMLRGIGDRTSFGRGWFAVS